MPLGALVVATLHCIAYRVPFLPPAKKNCVCPADLGCIHRMVRYGPEASRCCISDVVPVEILYGRVVA